MSGHFSANWPHAYIQVNIWYSYIHSLTNVYWTKWILGRNGKWNQAQVFSYRIYKLLICSGILRQLNTHMQKKDIKTPTSHHKQKLTQNESKT
jgi:hypothetical protein